MMEVHFKPVFVLNPLISHWLMQITWPSPNPRGREMPLPTMRLWKGGKHRTLVQGRRIETSDPLGLSCSSKAGEQ